MRTRPVSQVEVEEAISRLTAKLEEEVEVYAEAAEADADAEAMFKRLYHTAVLAVLDLGERERGGRYGDAEARKAAAHRMIRTPQFVARALASEAVPENPDPYRVHLIAAARREHAREAMRATASMLSAQQTLLRSLTNNLT